MTESANSSSASAAPTYTSERFKRHTIVVKVNNAVVVDAIPDRVDIGFGSDLSTAVFKLPRDPLAGGLPVEGNSVEFIVNDKSIFKGKIKVIADHVGGDGEYINYTCLSNIADLNNNVIVYGSFNSEQSDYRGLLFSVLGIFNRLGISAGGVPNKFPGEINVTDQTKLAAAESILAKIGNYKLYYDMATSNMRVYALGQGGINTRLFNVGQNVISYDLNKSVTNVVNKMIVVGNPTQVTRQTAVNNTTIEVADNGQRLQSFSLTGRNIRDITVEGLSREKPEITYDASVAITEKMFEKIFPPPKIFTPEWFDDTKSTENDKQLKQRILSIIPHEIAWSQVGTSLEYSGLDSVRVFISEVPKIWYIRTTEGECQRRVVDPSAIPGTDKVRIQIFDEFFYRVGSLRVTYTIDGSKPVVSVGGGAVTRSITDSQYQIVADGVTGYNNSAFMTQAMLDRANAELEKLNTPSITGTVTILGDETIDLRQTITYKGETLDVVHVSHDFTNGFTTSVSVTNESLRLNNIFFVGSSGSRGRGKNAETEKDRRRGTAIFHEAIKSEEQRNLTKKRSEKTQETPPKTPPYNIWR